MDVLALYNFLKVFWKNAWQFLDDFWYFEPHMHHEKMRYSPISLWMRKICLRDTVNVYFKYDYCIQFQRKKGMNMRNRHFGLRQNLKKNLQGHFSKKSLQEWVPNDSKWSETSRKRIVRMKIFFKFLPKMSEWHHQIQKATRRGNTS